MVRITGFSCWALGYMDNGHKMVGCLLHPGQNGGLISGTEWTMEINAVEKHARRLRAFLNWK